MNRLHTVLLTMGLLSHTGGEFAIRQKRFWFEHYAIAVDIHVHWIQLLGKIGDIVRQAQEMLLERIGARFAGHGQLVSLIVDGAAPFYGEQVFAINAVVKDDAALNFKHFCRSREVSGGHLGISFATSQQQRQ
ncbi:hypothetical protein ACPV5U_27620 [Vibrio mediterranei]